MDSASDASYITKRALRLLDLPVTKVTAFFRGLDQNTVKVTNRSTVTIERRSSVGHFTEVDFDAWVVPEIMTLPAVEENLEKKWPTLFERHNVADRYPRDVAVVDILLGQNILPYFKKLRVKRLGNLIAEDTQQGFVLSGRIEQGRAESDAVSLITTAEVEDQGDLNQRLRDFWSLEAIGITDQPENPLTQEEQMAVDHFLKTITFRKDEGLYEVGLPFKRDRPLLMDNLVQAQIRLAQVERKLKRLGGKATKSYINEFNGYLERNDIEEVVGERERMDTAFYLPFSMVCTSDKDRMVFDASARDPAGNSLNGGLAEGPKLQVDLTGTTLRFRMRRIVIIADIQKMFMRILLREEDRNYCRFLWRHPDNRDRPPKVFRFKKLPFGLNCSPYLAIAVVQHHVKLNQSRFPVAAKEILSSMYVDDLVSGADNVADAHRLFEETRRLLQEAGMSITKWMSNSKALMRKIPGELRAASAPVFLGHAEGADLREKALGIQWLPDKDCLVYQGYERFAHDPVLTKRGVSQVTSSIYDPHGLLAPVILAAKLHLQGCWIKGLDWDEQLPEPLRASWLKWLSSIGSLSHISIPRCLVDREQTTTQKLAVFTDASEKGYGAAVYLYAEYASGTTCRLVMAKTRPAPIEKVKLPRLELMGALLGARLSKFVQEQLEIQPSQAYYFSDSTIAIHWIRSTPHMWKQFVGNRVEEIHKRSTPANWNHVAGKENPADMASRGLTAQELLDPVKLEFWLHGPQFLEKFFRGEFQPGSLPVPNKKDQDAMDEEKKRVQVLGTTSKAVSKFEERLSALLNASSTWETVVKKLAFWLRLLKRRDKRPPTLKLSLPELQAAEVWWIRYAQRELTDYESLHEQVKDPNKDLRCKSYHALGVFWDEDTGLFRVRGRFASAGWSFEAKHQALLPKDHRVTELLCRREHILNLHAGAEWVLTSLRKRYWIPQGRRTVAKYIRKCNLCKRHEAKPAGQIMGQLPREKSIQAVFVYCGLDFAGPIAVKRSAEGETIKTWILLYTCMVTRALHLEVVDNMSSETFIYALRRVFARRGVPIKITSDNAKTFRRAAREIARLDFKEIDKGVLEQHRVTWEFIPEKSPAWGGFYERMVRTLKAPLKKILGRGTVTLEELQTITAEIEAVINDRPLSKNLRSIFEFDRVTPSDLLHGRPLRQVPDHCATEVQELKTASDVLARRVHQKTMMAHFWKKWTGQYLQELQVKRKWTKEHPDLKVGEMVIIRSDVSNQRFWPLGLVEEVFHGRGDNRVRAAIVRTHKGSIRRNVRELCPLELCDD